MYDYKKLSKVMEQALKVQKQMPPNINEVARETDTIINSLSKSGVLDLQRQVARQYKAFEFQIKILSQLQPMINHINYINNLLESSEFFNDIFVKNKDYITKILNSLGPVWINQLNDSDFRNISVDNLEKLTTEIKEFCNADNEKIKELKIEENDLIIFREYLNSLNFEEKNWQQKQDAQLEKWKEKNPIIYRIFKFFINFIITWCLTVMLNNAFQAYIATQNTKLKKEPSNISEVVAEIPQNSEVSIQEFEIKDQWLKLKLSIDNSDKSIVGWIEKNSILDGINDKE